MQQKIFEKLNEPQREAVMYKNGPMLVIAGAGSGKTRVLTHRIAYLVSENVHPSNILAITFTNKAAKEMAERVEELLGVRITNKPWLRGFASSAVPTIGTFHSIGARILREEAEVIGYTRNFAIYDDEEQKKLLKTLIQEQGVNEEQFPLFQVQSFIGNAKNELIPPEQFLNSPENYFEERIGKIYDAYQKKLKDLNAFDFDDLIMVPVSLFKKNEKVKERYQNQFQKILVDEYQDTNKGQYQFVKMLGEKHRDVFVVGDDFQGIYGFRGADIQNILSFEKDYPEAKIVLLEQNYRSTQNILDAAHEIIKKNTRQKEKKMWTENDQGDKLVSYVATDQEDEANFITSQIEKTDKSLRLGEIAILYRINAQSRSIEEAFLKAGIPYHIVGALRFYSRKEIKDVLAYLRILVNPKDEMSVRRIFNVPKRNLGKVSFAKMRRGAEKRGKMIGEALLDEEIFKEIKEDDPSTEKWEKLSLALISLKDSLKDKTFKDFLQYLIEATGYEEFLLNQGEEGAERLENVRELLTVSEKYGDEMAAENIENFLEEISLLSAEEKDPGDLKDKVQMMSIHSSKGLEFDLVFLTGMEEGIFPHSRSYGSELELEEERRLCYVAITRAKKKVFLSRALRRHLFGNVQANPPSRFLRELPAELLEEFLKEGSFSEFKLNIKIEEQEKPKVFKEKLISGDKIFHNVFGKGVVINIDGEIVTVAFAGLGIKKLDKTVAPIKRLDEKKRKRLIV